MTRMGTDHKLGVMAEMLSVLGSKWGWWHMGQRRACRPLSKARAATRPVTVAVQRGGAGPARGSEL